MQIVVDYKKEKDDCCYYNNVIAAIETANDKFFIKEVVFVNFPFKEITSLIALINRATKTGVIKFTTETLVYEKTECPLNVFIPDNL